MSVNSYLQDLASSLVLKDYEKDHVEISLNNIKSKLSMYFGGEISEKIVFGSYSRETILPRKADENSDIDLMIVFNNSERHKPQTFLNKLKTFAEHYYISSEIYQSSPTIVLELQHIKFELTPAYEAYGIYFIPNGPSEWMTTDSEGLNEKLIECNKNNVYKIKPIIRLLKYWNIKKNQRDIESYKIEQTVAEEMRISYLYATSYAEYLIEGLKKIKYKTNFIRVDASIQQIEKAISLENQGKINDAMEEIKKLLPEI